MHALIVGLALIGQAEVPIPPAPSVTKPAPAAVQPPAGADSTEEMKSWLLARLIIDLSFDPQKSAEVERMLGRMNEQQLRALVAAYQERTAAGNAGASPPRPNPAGNLNPSDQQALEQAKLNKQQAEAYRDHLKREYDRRLLQGYMNQNLVRQTLINNQQLMYFNSNPLGYSPLGFGGLGYGVMNYGGFGYGAPGFNMFYPGVVGVW